MIKIFIQPTHSKIDYKNTTDIIKEKSELIIKKTFSAEDTDQKYNPLVKRGLISAHKTFYYEDKNIIQTGFLPALFHMYDKEKILYEAIDMRKFPRIDKEFCKQLAKNEIIFNGPEDETGFSMEYIPRDYQTESCLMVAKNHGGIIQLPTGCLTGDTIININRGAAGKKCTIKSIYEAFNGLKKHPKYNYDKSIKTFVRSYIKNKNKILLNGVKSVFYSGIKKVFELKLENGYTLKATPDHKIMTSIGWIELQNLTTQHEVMCDTLKAQKSNEKRKKIRDNFVWNLWFHQYAKKVNTKKTKCGYSKRVENHRAIYEAHINGISLEEYKNILRNDEIKSKELHLINTDLYVIHHIDHNHYNNDVNNLQLMTIKDHMLYHSNNGGENNFNQGIPNFVKVHSVIECGEEPTYDIECYENHNFVANGIVVHNSGKSLLTLLLTKIYPQSKILMLFDSIDLINQTYDKFLEYGLSKDEVGIVQGSRVELDKRITLLSVDSYEKAVEIFPFITVLVVDEAHSVGSAFEDAVATRVLFSCQNASIRIGLSATADCLDNPARQMALYGNLGQIVYSKKIKEKSEDGTLAKMNVVIYNVTGFEIPVVGSWADQYDKILIKKGETENDYIDAGFEIIVENGKKYARRFKGNGDESNNIVYNDIRNKLISDLAQKNKHTLILYTRKEHGRQIAKYLPKDSYIMVDGDNSSNDRKDAVDFLKHDESRIVLASSIFYKGVDIPWAHTIIIAGAGKSTTNIIQRFGRGTRKDKYTNKTEATIIDFYDDFNPIVKKQSKRRIDIYKNELGFDITME